MSKSLTSKKPASEAQFRRVRNLTKEAIDEAQMEQRGFTHDELQAIHAHGREFKEGLTAHFLNFVRGFARELLGIVVPVHAQDTGLVPNGSKVIKDNPEGDLDLAKLDYSACPVREDEEYISGDTMMNRAAEMGAIGSLGFAAKLLKAQDQGKEIFPVESRGKHHFIMPLTELRDDDGYRRVAYFRWLGERWQLRFPRLDYRFYRFDRFVRRSEQPSAA